MRKFAVVSPVLPPACSGQATMLYRLLEPLPADGYCLISHEDYHPARFTATQYGSRLPGRYYRLWPSASARSSWLPIVPLCRMLLWVVQIARVARIEKCQAIVACTAGLMELPCAYLASRLLGVDFYAYYFDDYEHQWKPFGLDWFARWWAARFVPAAKAMFVPNETIAADLLARHGVVAHLVRNPVDLSQYDIDPAPTVDPEQHMLYTGAVYEAQYDSIARLLQALEFVPGMRLRVYTADPADQLRRHSIAGPKLDLRPHRHVHDIPLIQRRAGLLFLPLAFSTSYPDLIRNSAPGKLGEYLAARRPIVAHVPPDSFVAHYLRKYDCGLVVDCANHGVLARALRELIDDPERQSQLVANGWARAQADFDVRVIRDNFHRSINGAVITAAG